MSREGKAALMTGATVTGRDKTAFAPAERGVS